MAGTRTAPVVTGTPTNKKVSVSYFDNNGDQRTVSLYLDNDATAVEIEAEVSALQSASQASIWKVEIADVFEGAKLASNASGLSFSSVHDNIVIHMKKSATDSQRQYIPAPIASILVTGTETVDPTDPLFTGVLSNLTPMMVDYAPQSARFTERRDINDSTPL